MFKTLTKKITNFGTFNSTSSSSSSTTTTTSSDLSIDPSLIISDTCDDQITITPQLIESSSSSSSSLSSNEKVSMMMTAEFYQSKKAKLYVIALHNYNPVNDDTDLPLIKGEQYEILDSSGVWWMARDLYNKQIGLVPYNYLEIIDNKNSHENKLLNNDNNKKFPTKYLSSPSLSSPPPLPLSKNFNNSPSSTLSLSSSSSETSLSSFNIEMLSLFQQLWFFSIDRETAEQLLCQPCNPDGCFLVRPSSTENNCLTLSVLIKNKNQQSQVKHYLIQRAKLSRILDSIESSSSSSSLTSLSSCSSYNNNNNNNNNNQHNNSDNNNNNNDNNVDNKSKIFYFIRPQEKFPSIESLIEYYRKNRGHLITRLSQIPCRANFIWQKSSMILQHQKLINSLLLENNSPSSIINNNNDKKHHKHPQKQQKKQINENTNYNNKQKLLSKNYTNDLTRDKSWEIKVNDLQLLEELGSGQFGVVRHGKWKGKYDVAVKLMKEGTMSERDFIEEAKVMTKLQHQNLVKLHGICIEHRPICIVAEFMKHSSLLSFLRKNEQKILDSPQRIKFLLNMCKQVASGMAYLESHNYIHRDLAARNCLVGHGNIVKVADFGLTRYVIDDEYTSSGGTKFPIRWAPPEVLWFTRFSSKSDVWAYGILTWEVFSLGKLPYGKLTNAEVVEKIREGHRLDKPKQWCPNDIFQIMKMCWHELPEKRPSFKKIESYLFRLKENDFDKHLIINNNNNNNNNNSNNNGNLILSSNTTKNINNNNNKIINLNNKNINFNKTKNNNK